MKPYEKIQAKIASDIKTSGWSGRGIFGEDEDNPSFFYTTGLDLQGLPELLVVGLPSRSAHVLAHMVIELMQKEGVPEDKTIRDDMAENGYRLAFCDVDPARACKTYMLHTENFYGYVPARVMQLVWSDKKNILPFEAGCDERLARWQSRVRDYRKEVVHGQV